MGVGGGYAKFILEISARIRRGAKGVWGIIIFTGDLDAPVKPWTFGHHIAVLFDIIGIKFQEY